MHPHSELIDSLGGAGALAMEFGLAANVTSNWRKRGISWPYRAKVVDLARRKRVAIPAGFLDPSAPAEPADNADASQSAA